ncbi:MULTISPECIES: DUF4148 domain-containing protein [Burkholderia]|uniref:DUF4148 domain-containing protein n=1 Tax=Burkholderia TaxID=32008 RepID=UPI0009E3EB79|nr:MULTISPECIES: DUF4148 domain-containing protein [Burkholderia]
MKIQFLVAAIAGAVSITSFADEQSTHLTRAQVASELESLHHAGYSPQDWAHYPENIQAAERRVQAQRTDAPAKS